MSERLHEAAERLAEVARGMYDAGHALGGLQCREVAAIADVLRAIDADDAADILIEAHGEGDDDYYDAHHDIYLRSEGREDEIPAWRAELAAHNAEIADEHAADVDTCGTCGEPYTGVCMTPHEGDEARRETARQTADMLRNSRGDTDRLAEAAAHFDDIAEGRA